MRSGSWLGVVVLLAVGCTGGGGGAEEGGSSGDPNTTQGDGGTVNTGSSSSALFTSSSAAGGTSSATSVATSGTASSAAGTSSSSSAATASSSHGSTSASSSSGGAPTFCQESCAATGDCLQGFVCTEHRCVYPSAAQSPCTGNSECRSRLSNWTTECATDAACPGQVCISVGSKGYCAWVPSGGMACTAMGMVETSMPRRDGSGTVTVCGNTTAVCQAGACFNPCVDDSTCDGNTPHCNPGTGRCECTADSCQHNASVCVAGACRCTRSADCTENNADTCQDGVCGCGSLTACTGSHVHPGTAWVCETFTNPVVVTSSSSSGAGGSSSSGTGTASSSGSPGPNVCQESCTQTSDCQADFVCAEHRCVHPGSAASAACTGDPECKALFSGWTKGCADDSGCQGTVCVAVGSTGYCAFQPSPYVACSAMGMEEVAAPRQGASGTVTVCGNATARCETGTCWDPCTSDAKCGGDYPHCNTGTGRCECTPTSCNTNTSVCVAGQCRCAGDEDCTLGNVDQCVGGVCACSSASTCANPLHPHTSWVCEPYRVVTVPASSSSSGAAGGSSSSAAGASSGTGSSSQGLSSSSAAASSSSSAAASSSSAAASSSSAARSSSSSAGPPVEACNLLDDTANNQCDENVPGCRVRMVRMVDAYGYHAYSLQNRPDLEPVGFTQDLGAPGFAIYVNRVSNDLVPLYRCVVYDVSSYARYFLSLSASCDGTGTATQLGWATVEPRCGGLVLDEYVWQGGTWGDWDAIYVVNDNAAEVNYWRSLYYFWNLAVGYVWLD